MSFFDDVVGGVGDLLGGGGDSGGSTDWGSVLGSQVGNLVTGAVVNKVFGGNMSPLAQWGVGFLANGLVSGSFGKMFNANGSKDGEFDLGGDSGDMRAGHGYGSNYGDGIGAGTAGSDGSGSGSGGGILGRLSNLSPETKKLLGSAVLGGAQAYMQSREADKQRKWAEERDQKQRDYEAGMHAVPNVSNSLLTPDKFGIAIPNIKQ